MLFHRLPDKTEKKNHKEDLPLPPVALIAVSSRPHDKGLIYPAYLFTPFKRNLGLDEPYLLKQAHFQ